MNFVQKKLGDLLKTNDQSQICTILILFGILCFLIFLTFYTWNKQSNISLYDNIKIIYNSYSISKIK